MRWLSSPACLPAGLLNYTIILLHLPAYLLTCFLGRPPQVLRQKLPPGVRELAVSLGSGDASSYRRLEAGRCNSRSARFSIAASARLLLYYYRQVGIIVDEV